MKSLITICLLTSALAATGTAQSTGQQRARSANAHGIASRGFLGVAVLELTEERVKALRLKDDHGVLIYRIAPGSPAAEAGLRINDVILEVDGKTVDGIEQFQTSIGETAPGTKVNLTIWREGAKRTLTATLYASPAVISPFNFPDFPDQPAPPMPPVPFNGGNPGAVIPGNSPTVGFEGEGLGPQLAEYFGVKEGVLVRSVNPKTPAERAGLKAGDVVVKVNGTPVTTPREITGVLRSSGKRMVSFTVVRNKKEIALNVEIAEQLPERIAL